MLDRKITLKISADKSIITAGTAENLAGMLVFVEANIIAAGIEGKIFHAPGKAACKTRFIDFVEADKAAWQK